jgi:hypothetical protein
MSDKRLTNVWKFLAIFQQNSPSLNTVKIAKLFGWLWNILHAAPE